MWQQLVWIFLHSFAEKIKEDVYIKNQEECYNFLLKIYENIYCKRCSIHSIIYLKNKQHSLSTKEDLINYLFDFHNHVNIKLGNKVFEKDILEKYKCANIDNIFMNYTTRITKNIYIIDFLKNNKHCFN